MNNTGKGSRIGAEKFLNVPVGIQGPYLVTGYKKHRSRGAG